MGEKKPASLPPPEPVWQEGAGGLLLLAAAQETGLLEALERSVPVSQAAPTSRLAHSMRASRRRLFLTLLFLGAVGLQRTWDLRAYTGAGLALLSERKRAYSYRHVERFLSEVAQAGGAEGLTDALAAWTMRLWKPAATDGEPSVPVYYLDGHKKSVYSDCLLPRGVIGRTGKILGCRALLLLHDDRGHPLLATTHRGDLHLTLGAPSLITRYETAAGETPLRRLVIDREGMAAEFLAKLAAEGRWVVTILRTEQYHGLESFTDVGAFLPVARDQAGQVTREVAPARFLLTLPEQPGQFLPLAVALIRDWRAQVPVPPTEADGHSHHYPPKDTQGRSWWMEGWEPTPLPSTPLAPKLIPIVTTAPDADPVELAQLYRRRWPVQENILKDWLLPLGLDTNHGFAKSPVENSEVAKRREALERRLANIQRWAPKAHERAQHDTKLANRLWQETKAHGDALYRRINLYICEHDRGDEREWRLQHKPVVKAMKAEADADLDERWRRYARVSERGDQESTKHRKYCLEQCELLRALVELEAKERAMYEVDHCKDQTMTVLKLALVNVGMWVRDQYFPTEYVHATWNRLVPFFRLAGRVTEEQHAVWVELRPFNDRQLNRDLQAMCQRVAAVQPRLPDGRRLRFTVTGMGWLTSAGYPYTVAGNPEQPREFDFPPEGNAGSSCALLNRSSLHDGHLIHLRDMLLMFTGSGTRAPISPAEFTTVLEQEQETLYRFLWGLVGNVEQARDLLQDTFHDAWRLALRQEPPFLAGGSHEEMRYWLFRVAYHRAISALRRRRLIRWESLEESHERDPEVFAALRSFENDLAEREALRAALERLSSQDVACLFLRLVQGFTPVEIAQILGASPVQISKRLARAKQRLRNIYLAEEGQLKNTTAQKGVQA